MRNKIINIILVLCVLAGVGIFVYPFVSNMLHDRKQDEIITEYDEQMENLAEDEKAQMLEAARQYNEDLIGNIRVYETFWKNVEDAGDSGTSETDTARFSRLYEQMTAYNEQIFTEKQKNFCDPWSYEQSSFDLTRYGIEDNVAATIEIPRMDVELPIYLGATAENMALGAVQLGQTSLPVGGENTNCVIAAHRGYQGIPMFREIEKLQPGDKVIIRNFWETLRYEVSEIEVICPSDIDKILIRPGEDMVTLLTCHPYTQNTRRYAVFCTRISGGEEGRTDTSGSTTAELSVKAAEQAAVEDADILQREKLLRTAGYGFLAIVSIAIIGRMIWNGIRSRYGRHRKMG